MAFITGNCQSVCVCCGCERDPDLGHGEHACEDEEGVEGLTSLKCWHFQRLWQKTLPAVAFHSHHANQPESQNLPILLTLTHQLKWSVRWGEQRAAVVHIFITAGIPISHSFSSTTAAQK